MLEKNCAYCMSTLLCLAISMALIAFTIPGWFIWADFRPFKTQKHLYFYDYFSLIDLITQNEDMIQDSIEHTIADIKGGEIVTSISWWAANSRNLLDDTDATYFLDLFQFREEFCFCQGCDVIRNYDEWYDNFCLVLNQWVAGSIVTALFTCFFLFFGCIAMLMPVIHIKQAFYNAQFPCKSVIANGVFMHIALIMMTIAFIVFTTVLYTIEYRLEMEEITTIAGASVYEGAFCFTWIAYLFYCCGYRRKFSDAFGNKLHDITTEMNEDNYKS